jgi:hypothetical protein
MSKIPGIIVKSVLAAHSTIAVLLLLFCSASQASQLSPANIDGYLHLTWVNSESGDEVSRTLNQEYSIYWKKRLVPYLEAKAYLRYHNLGINQDIGANAWRQEFQPAGELIWSHPHFAAGGSLRRQRSTSNNEATNLIRDNIGANFSTKMFKYPILKFRYLWDRTFNELDRDTRDTRERNLHLSLDYDLRNHSFYYNFARRSNQNLVSLLEIVDIQHILRWSQSGLWMKDRLRISSGYNFNYRSQMTEQSAAGSALTVISVLEALYGHDVSPDRGELDSLSSLMDGNISDPVQPYIDIGEGLVDHNIGVDLGFEQDVSALYIYTDRPSGSQLSWSIFISADNLTWNLLPALSTAGFNVSYNRYEISFPLEKVRYIKAVNSGFNDIATVLVTEIQALVESYESGRYTKKRLSHLLDFSETYSFSDKLESSFDLTYRNEPRGDFTDSRNQLYYTLTGKHSPWERITHIVQYQRGYDDYQEKGIREENTNISYAVLTRPLETVDISLSMLTRNNYLNSVETQQTDNIFLHMNGDVFPGLGLRGEVGFSRNNRIDTGNKVDTWSYRISSESYITRSIDVLVSYHYQSARNLTQHDSRIKRQYSIYSNYRVTRAILLRSSILINDENTRHYISQDHNLSWNVSQKLNLGSSANIIEGDNNVRTEKYGASLNYLVALRTSVFLSYLRNESTLADEPARISIQLGLKSGF